MKVFDKLTDSQKTELKAGVIEVSGKAMNRTALGIVDAMLRLYPNLTFTELKLMLPDSINPSAPRNFKSLFKPFSERLYGVVQPGSIRKEYEEQGLDLRASHFLDEGETFRTADGVEVLVSRIWESADTSTGENDLQKLIDHVAQYGIKVVKFEKKVGRQKGEYQIEVINPNLLSAISEKPKSSSKMPLWIGIGAIILLAGLVLLLTREKVQKTDKNPTQVEADSGKNH